MLLATAACGVDATDTSGTPSTTLGESSGPAPGVGPQYDAVHVYVPPGELDNFANSWNATFGGTSTPAAVVDVTPTPSQTRSKLVQSPVGALSVFEYTTPTPYPFGAERTGWLLADFDAGVQAAQASGAVVVVAPFNDPIGRDAIIQFPGGVFTQLYWHTKAPSYPALQTVPDNHVYLPPAAADDFLKSYLGFTRGTVSGDDHSANGALIGLPGSTFRQIHITSVFGSTVVYVTDGHLPYPFGRDVAGYGVIDVAATLDKARSAGATVVSPPVTVNALTTAVLQFPGGYIAEVHTA